MESTPDLSTIQNDTNTQVIPENAPSEIQSIKPVIDNTIERRRIILVIQRYLLEFEKYLPQDLKQFDYSQLTQHQLEELLNEIKFTVSVRNSGKMSERAVIMSIQQFENIACKFTPLKVQGLTNICRDEDFLLTVKEFCLENINLFYCPASYRLMYAISMACLSLHMANSARSDNIGQETAKPIAVTEKLKGIDEKFNNI